MWKEERLRQAPQPVTAILPQMLTLSIEILMKNHNIRASSRPVGYMRAPMIRSSVAFRSVRLCERQLPLMLQAKSFAWPVRIIETSRFFMPMTEAVHLFHNGSSHSFPGISSKDLMAAQEIFECNLPQLRSGNFQLKKQSVQILPTPPVRKEGAGPPPFANVNTSNLPPFVKGDRGGFSPPWLGTVA
jgi:hypothetical protein